MACNHCTGGCGVGPQSCSYCPAPPEYYENFPFYNGPCAPGPRPPRPCIPCCPPWFPPIPSTPEYKPQPSPAGASEGAFFVSGAPLDVQAGGFIPLEAVNVTSPSIESELGGIRLQDAVLYLVIYTVLVPVSPPHPINTVLRLNLNGESLAGSAKSLITSPNNATGFVAGQVMFDTPADSFLTMQSSGAISLDASAGSAISVSVLRLS